MIITKEILKNLELKYGKLSPARCAEINAMKIKNPYHPRAYFTPGEFFDAEKTTHYFIYTMEGRIAFIDAFYPMPIIRRESAEDYDDIYLLFIDDEWFDLIFDLVDFKQEIIENKRIYRYKYNLRENKKLNQRTDINEILYLVGILKCANKNLFSNIENDFFEGIIIYMGKEYKWMHY